MLPRFFTFPPWASTETGIGLWSTWVTIVEISVAAVHTICCLRRTGDGRLTRNTVVRLFACGCRRAFIPSLVRYPVTGMQPSTPALHVRPERESGIVHGVTRAPRRGVATGVWRGIAYDGRGPGGRRGRLRGSGVADAGP